MACSLAVKYGMQNYNLVEVRKVNDLQVMEVAHRRE